MKDPLVCKFCGMKDPLVCKFCVCWDASYMHNIEGVLKGLAQAKIIKKSVILFWLLNIIIWCKHVHRLEMQKF